LKINNQITFQIVLFFLFVTLNVNAQSDTQRLFNEAKQLSNDRKYERSNDAYQALLPSLLQEENWPLYYRARNDISRNYLDLYQFEKGQQEVEAAIVHFQENYRDSFIIWQPKLYHTAGQAHYDQHHYDQARTNYRKAMKLYQKLQDDKERMKYTSYMYNNIGSSYKQQRLMDSALHYFQVALPLKKKALGESANSTLRTIKGISGIYQDWGQLDKAIETQTIALNGALSTKNKDAEAQAYNGLSQMYQRKRDYETSKKYISKSMEIYRKMPEYKLDLAHSYHQMGNVLETEKAHKESLEWYTTAKRMYREIHNGKASYQEGNSTMNLGKAHNYMAGQLEASSPEYDATHPEVKALRAKGIEYFEENERIFTEAVGADHARFIELWLSKGVCLFENLDTVGAHNLFSKAYERAYKLAPDKSYDRSLSCLNLAKTSADPDSAIALYQRGLWELSNDWEPTGNGDNPTAEESFYEDWSVEIMQRKAKRFIELYQRDNNQEHLKDGISTLVAADGLLQDSRASYLTTSAKISLGKRGHDIYAKGVELCHELGDQAPQAFDFIEKNKGLVLLEALHYGNDVRELMVPDSLSSQLRRLSDRIEELKTQQNNLKESERLSEIGAIIFDLEEERSSLKEKISAAYPVTKKITENNLVIDLETVQHSLASDEVAYEYLETTDELFILKIETSKSKLFKISSEDYKYQLDSLLLIINDQDIATNRSNSPAIWTRYQRLAYHLYQKLLPDHENENLLIIPDGRLNYLPFELLLTDKKKVEKINYSRLPYLLKSSIIKYAFSSSLHYADVQIASKKQQPLLAIAPEYPASPRGLLSSRAGFTALEHIASEAETITAIMNGNKLIGTNATRTSFKNQAASYKVLHLAMHAYTHDTDPMLSGMIFSDVDDEDNILHAYELYNMDIPSQMVVLSACNTGLGQYQKGEGVMSLGRAFRHAGTQNVIMSLWQANDETTSDVMAAFYTNLKEGQPKAEALRNAKLSYLESGANVFPYFWGSFVLLGDDLPLELSGSSWVMWSVLLGATLLAFGIFLIRRKEKYAA